MKLRTPVIATTALVGLGVATAAATPVIATGTSTAVCSAVPADLALIAAEPATGVAAVSAAGVESLPMELPAPAQLAGRGPDGTVWVQVGDNAHNGTIVRVAPGGGPAAAAHASAEARLLGVGWADEQSAALFADYTYEPRDDIDTYGGVFLATVDGTVTDLGPSGGPEFGIASGGLGDGVVTAGWWADLTETFTFTDTAGNDVTGYANPAAGAPYNDVPLWLWPLLSDATSSADPVLLSWIEGPDYPMPLDGGDPELTGSWIVAFADARGGTELARVELPHAPEAMLLQASFDGRFWVGTFGTTVDEVTTPATSYVVDIGAAEPVASDLACGPGVVVTIDRNGDSAPITAPSAPPADDTGCAGTYDDATGELPVRHCTKGQPVAVVQTFLTIAGYDTEVDGYFGPATLAAVQEFQGDHDLAVDGLVGPRTWTALLTAVGIDPDDLSLDTNGNGQVDPADDLVDPPGTGG